MGMFRVGSDQYAAGDDADLRGVHPAPRARPVPGRLRGLRVPRQGRHRAGTPDRGPGAVPGADSTCAGGGGRGRRLFGYWDGRDWRDVRSDEVNGYLRDASGGEMTAKDFRTWHATVLAATELATVGPPRSVTARRRAVVGGDARGRRTARQHPDGGPDLLRGPAGGRPLPRRGGGAGGPGGAARGGRAGRCWSCWREACDRPRRRPGGKATGPEPSVRAAGGPPGGRPPPIRGGRLATAPVGAPGPPLSGVYRRRVSVCRAGVDSGCRAG